MCKKSKAQRTKNTMNTPLSVVPFNTISQQDLEDTIVKALISYEKAKKDSESKELEERNQNRNELLGYKDYSDRKGVVRWFLTFFNRTTVFFKILFMSRDKIEGDFATTNIMKFTVSFLFSIAKWILWLVSFAMLSYYPLSLIVSSLPKISLPAYPISILIGVLSFIFAQLFRIASIEIEKMEDHNYIVDVFAAVAAIVAIIISIIIR